MFAEKAVLFLSQDVKARVPLGLPAANKQSRIALHLQYRIRLPDHDWSFQDSVLSHEDQIKPIVLVTVDGSPDENPRYTKTLLA
uniref:Uncharacterized protein n=1 Tax=Acrobeloides nanus TaxID=290746 RepID=A0A914DII2_9BILA